ncbi:MAG TPA: hypothetical protein VHO25_22080 [Polyangiaceae bacterium]|nr:hypothetical protein [Polyangiaceae bacterium]
MTTPLGEERWKFTRLRDAERFADRGYQCPVHSTDPCKHCGGTKLGDQTCTPIPPGGK